jgi:hypothetical protein
MMSLWRGAPMGIEKQDYDQDWENAQAALAAAQAMPGGPARIEALKKAGKLRFKAATKLISAFGGSRAADTEAKKNPPV